MPSKSDQLVSDEPGNGRGQRAREERQEQKQGAKAPQKSGSQWLRMSAQAHMLQFNALLVLLVCRAVASNQWPGAGNESPSRSCCKCASCFGPCARAHKMLSCGPRKPATQTVSPAVGSLVQTTMTEGVTACNGSLQALVAPSVCVCVL